MVMGIDDYMNQIKHEHLLDDYMDLWAFHTPSKVDGLAHDVGNHLLYEYSSKDDMEFLELWIDNWYGDFKLLFRPTDE